MFESEDLPSGVRENLAELHEHFLSSGQTLGFAESCTGGLISSTITSQSGASRYFKGAIVSYAGSVKVSQLGVPFTSIKAHGEVSLPVAKAMAKGCREALECDWAVSVTGIAGPSGGTEEKPVGLVCFGVSGPGIEYSQQVQFENEGRQVIQWRSVASALEFLKNSIQS